MGKMEKDRWAKVPKPLKEKVHDARRAVRGELIHTAKLTSDDVLEIRKIYGQGDISQTRLAKQFGVDTSTIYKIVNRKRWTHI